MKTIWLSTHQNWYYGITHDTPPHKNSLELTNLAIKIEKLSENICHCQYFCSRVSSIQPKNGQKNICTTKNVASPPFCLLKFILLITSYCFFLFITFRLPINY